MWLGVRVYRSKFSGCGSVYSQGGKYVNLKEIQDDMILMIKNAHYFNEPGSEIYKVCLMCTNLIV